MAGDFVKYDYEQLEEMAHFLNHGAKAIGEHVKQTVTKVTSQMQQGGFMGKAGDHLASALSGQLSKSIDNLANFYADMGRGIEQAANDMKHADQNAAKKF